VDERGSEDLKQSVAGLQANTETEEVRGGGGVKPHPRKKGGGLPGNRTWGGKQPLVAKIQMKRKLFNIPKEGENTRKRVNLKWQEESLVSADQEVAPGKNKPSVAPEIRGPLWGKSVELSKRTYTRSVWGKSSIRRPTKKPE